MISIFLKAQDSGWYHELLTPVVEAISANNGNRKILDIGTGPGKLPELLISRNDAMQITGIDISPSMIDESRKRLTHENVSFKYQKPGAPLDFADAEFDVVSFCSVLFLLDDDSKTFLMNEAVRVLKPDGKIVILTPSGKNPMISAFSKTWGFPYRRYNWTYLVWKTLTSNRGRAWQNQQWLVRYANEKELNYSTSLIFGSDATIETITSG